MTRRPTIVYELRIFANDDVGMEKEMDITRP